MKKVINKHAANSKGFSLIEMLVVITLIVILVAIGVPAVLNQMAHIRFTRDVRDISVELGAARMNAISKNKRYGVYFTQGAPDAYSVQTCSDSPAPASSSACVVWATDTTKAMKTLSSNSGIVSPGSDFRVEFLPTGMATATNITVINTASETEQMIINVNAATGRISIT